MTGLFIFFLNNSTYAEIASIKMTDQPLINDQLITKVYQLPQNSFEQIVLVLSQENFTNIYINNNLKFDSSILKTERNYYDTKDLKLLNHNNSLYFQTIIKNNSPVNKLNVTYSNNDNLIIFSSGQQLSHYELRKKNKVVTPEDKHPLLGKIKRDERKQLIQQLNHSGIKELFSIKKILSIQTQTLTHFLFYKRKQFASLSLAYHTTEALGQKVNYLELMIKLHADFNHESSPDINQLRLDILSYLSNELQQKIIEDTSTPYKKAFEELSQSQNSYFLKLFILYPMIFKLLQVIFYSILGTLLLLLLFKKRIL